MLIEGLHSTVDFFLLHDFQNGILTLSKWIYYQEVLLYCYGRNQ